MNLKMLIAFQFLFTSITVLWCWCSRYTTYIYSTKRGHCRIDIIDAYHMNSNVLLASKVFFTYMTAQQSRCRCRLQYICEELPSPCCIAWPLPHTPLIFTCLANSPLDLAIKLKTLYEQNVSRITFETGLCISFYNFLDICFCLKVLFYLFVELCHQNLLWRISCKQCDWWGMSYITALRDPPLPHTPTHKLQPPTRKCKPWKIPSRPKLLSSVEYLKGGHLNGKKPVPSLWQFLLNSASTH